MGYESRNGLAASPSTDSETSSISPASGPAWSGIEVPEDDPRVVRALETYIAACERGERPNRRRFLDEHAAVASTLRECLDSLDYLDAAAPHFHSSPLEPTGPFAAPGSDVQPPKRLGDYEIIREIGRGGMGVVYEAEQSSLGRRVALKLLPFTAAVDKRQVQRFQVEVQAAAHLHHPHIVPIYGVGCEGGTHYYAMQLISGQSLAAIINTLRALRPSCSSPWSAASCSEALVRESQEPSPHGSSRHGGGFFRGVARLGVQAASALEHAHSLGVVHRDVKPANLMVDHRDQLWVADFGLAQLQGDSGLTITGDLLGTLRYMSPEQALARRGVVDHRTDLYSLGVTLYELVTLHPAFEGGDIQSLVHQITSEDPPPPSRSNPLIPRDLETIILKAMAKEPVNRYATAQEMADDLQRFLDDQPILARRPSPHERAIRWARRHRSVVVSGGVALFLALICLSISVVAIWSAMARTDREAQARMVELNRAQINLELAHRALDLYLETAESWFPRDIGGELQDRALLENALAFYEQIAAQNQADPKVQPRTFRAFSKVGALRAALSDGEGAEQAYRRALFILIDLERRDPHNEHNQAQMADVLGKYASLLQRSSVYVSAEWAVNEAIRILQELADRFPSDNSYRLALSRARNQMSGIKGETGRITEALSDSHAALNLLAELKGERENGLRLDQAPLDRDLVSVYINLGKWLQLDAQLGEAEEVYRKALSLLEQLEADKPGALATREALSTSQVMLAELLRATRRPAAAEALFKESIQGFERLAGDYPRMPRYRKYLARVYASLSTFFSTNDRFREADEARRKAESWEPKENARQQVHFNNLAWYLTTAPNPAARKPAQGLELARKAVHLDPMSWYCWNTLGVARYRNKDWKGAREALERATEKHPGVNAFDGFFLAMVHWQMGHREEARTWLGKSEYWRLLNLPGDIELLRFRAEAQDLIGALHDSGSSSRTQVPSSVAEALNDPSFGLPRFRANFKPAHKAPNKVISEVARPPQKAAVEISEVLEQSPLPEPCRSI